MIDKKIYDILKKAIPSNDLSTEDKVEKKNKDANLSNSQNHINKSGNITIISGSTILAVITILVLIAVLFFQQTSQY